MKNGSTSTLRALADGSGDRIPAMIAILQRALGVQSG